MGEVAVAKVVKAKKVAKPATHAPFATLITVAIGKLGEKKGSSRKAILKYIVANNKIGDEAKAARHVNTAIRKLVAAKKIDNLKGIHGKFRLPKAEPKKVVKKPAAKKVKKPAAKKPKTPKKAAAKKPAAKKPKTPKKAVKKPAAKKPKTPKKAAKKAAPKKK